MESKIVAWAISYRDWQDAPDCAFELSEEGAESFARHLKEKGYHTIRIVPLVERSLLDEARSKAESYRNAFERVTGGKNREVPLDPLPWEREEKP